ncbi:MAG: Uma2 family endonuclease [Chloroflexota bacterium]
MAVQHAVSVEEFEHFLADFIESDRHFELINGEIVEKMPTQLHAYIIAILTNALMNFLRINPMGRALPEARYRMSGDNTHNVIPALSFITNEKGKLVSEGAAPYMPDLAVEVQSKGQSEKFMVNKAAYYLANGSRMVWLVYPEKRIVEVLTPDFRELLTEEHTLTGGDVLPGFSLPVREIFAQ